MERASKHKYANFQQNCRTWIVIKHDKTGKMERKRNVILCLGLHLKTRKKNIKNNNLNLKKFRNHFKQVKEQEKRRQK